MAEYLIQDTTLDAIADAINAKTGGSSAMTPAEMVTAIGNISGGSGVSMTLIGETPVMGYANNSKNQDLCTVDVDNLDYDAILFITPDKTGYKLVPYLPSTIVSQLNGLIHFVSQSANFVNAATAASFGIGARADASVTTLTITHDRVTGTNGAYYSEKNTAFNIYAVKLGIENW